MADENTLNQASADPATDALVVNDIAPDGTGSEGKRGATQFARDEAGKLIGQAGDSARSFVDTGKERASGVLDEFSTLMRDAATSVDEKIGEQYGAYARSAADQLSGFAESLRGKQVDDLVDDARDFVKKSPAVAIGVAASVGFVIARLLKSGLDAAGDLADRNTSSGDAGSREA